MNAPTLVSDIAGRIVSLASTLDDLNAWPQSEVNRRALAGMSEDERNHVRRAWADRRRVLTQSKRRAA